MRLSIKKHNQAYLQSLAKEMQIEDLGEALNYILVNIRGLGWRYGDAPALQSHQSAPIGFDSNTFEPAFTQENHRNSLEVDPTIQRLIDAGLEMEF